MIYTINIKNVAGRLGLDCQGLLGHMTGVEVKNFIINAIGEVTKGDALELSFEGVACDAPFLDQAVFEVQRHIRKEKPETMIIIANMSENVFDNIFYVINTHENQGRRTPIIIRTHNGLSGVGGLEPFLESAMAYLLEHGEVTARELADVEGGMIVNSASNRLKRLFDLGLALRTVQTPAFGQRYKYYLPVKEISREIL